MFALAEWLRGCLEQQKGDGHRHRIQRRIDEAIMAGEFIDSLRKINHLLEIEMATANENVTKLLAKEQALKAQVADLQAQLATAGTDTITPELNASVEAEVADAPATPAP